MPSIYKYYNSGDSSYTYSIINKPVSSKITKLQLGDSTNTISTTLNQNELTLSSSLILEDGKTFKINGITGDNKYALIVEGTRVAVNGNINNSYNFDVTGNASISTDLVVGNDLAVTGRITSVSDLKVNTNKFVVTASSGNTSIAGDLDITNNLKVNTNKFVVTASSGNTSIAGDLNVTGAFLGRVPLGGIIPILPVFQLTGNSGSKTTLGIPSSGSLTSDGFQLCDGSLINDANSTFINKYVPNLTDERFIKGSILSNIGNIGKDNTASLIEANLPNHSHTISHTHSGTTETESATHTHPMSRSPSFDGFTNLYGMALSNNQSGNESTGINSNSHTHNFTTSSPSSSNSGSIGSGTSFDITPKFINVVYLMRVK